MRTDQRIVIDASAAVALVAQESEGQAVRLMLVDWSKQKRSICVPSLFWLEVVNTFLRRRRWSGADTLEAIHRLDVYQLDTVEQDRALVVAALDLGERHELSAYDATYVALAIRLDARLLTLDRRLALAAGERAVSLGDRRVSEAHVRYEREVTWPNYRGASALLAKLRAEIIREGC
jgi:predicted nucleic acid-binding protein